MIRKSVTKKSHAKKIPDSRNLRGGARMMFERQRFRA